MLDHPTQSGVPAYISFLTGWVSDGNYPRLLSDWATGRRVLQNLCGNRQCVSHQHNALSLVAPISIDDVMEVEHIRTLLSQGIDTIPLDYWEQLSKRVFQKHNLQRRRSYG